MTNVLLSISYDGTDFSGWQRQDKSDGGKPVRTVQGEIEEAISKMLKVPAKLYGSGRTDSGVHARAQKANFFSPCPSIPPSGYVRALNGFLPRDIRIQSAEIVPESFNSRFSATSRSYRYFIRTGTTPPLASETRYVWYLPHELDLDHLNQMASFLHGETDCATFSAAGDQSLSTRRYIDRAAFFREDSGSIVFEIEANAFLWKMIRSLVGTFTQLDMKGAPPSAFREILESRDRRRALMTAPPAGLFLWDVKFDGIRRHV